MMDHRIDEEADDEVVVGGGYVDEEEDDDNNGDEDVYFQQQQQQHCNQQQQQQQLTLSFHGQVYVFDHVTPEKVQAVLLLLGSSQEVEDEDIISTHPHLHLVAAPNPEFPNLSSSFPLRCTHPQRAASLTRFRQKRQQRCFDKKIRYDVRQQVALRMNRNKGQFTSSKDCDQLPTSTWDAVPDSLQGPVDTFCAHCGTGSQATPMMRRGPNGPKSLCNACGLFWSNRGTLRDLPMKMLDLPLISSEQEEDGVNGISYDMNSGYVSFSMEENKDFVGQQQ